MRTKTDMVIKNHYLTSKEVEKLYATSKDMGISSSELLRRIIDEYFDKLEKRNANSKVI